MTKLEADLWKRIFDKLDVIERKLDLTAQLLAPSGKPEMVERLSRDRPP